MKTIIFVTFIAAAFAAPQSQNAYNQPPQSDQVRILHQDFVIKPDGSYEYSYETENGISGKQTGELANIGAEEPALRVQGEAHYTSLEGTQIDLTYTADENGYHPQGSHLPTPPPIPADIQRSLDYLATASPQPETQEYAQNNYQNYPQNVQG